MHNMDDEPDEFYELAMPFVVVKSKDGPYDDDSYCAGYEMGAIDAQLCTLPGGAATLAAVIQEANKRQADLLAMRYNFSASFTPPENGWVHVEFRRIDVCDHPHVLPRDEI